METIQVVVDKTLVENVRKIMEERHYRTVVEKALKYFQDDNYQMNGAEIQKN